ncbi:hypothetical protein MTP99_000263 [Tenebrio molitor]|jgi:hypothetical protein|uniref:SAYSvFN domain-containing protein n=1 Tax=Tenebrio molitor TaxID=7067 RepID=A0A8J6L7F1_TENMO|nr:hypothetical protein GEV33_012268 [Tenebrio molitor]KAJ3636749.1 hypothetical protein MTP99_000263 [Tenebrio molitor]
MEQKLAEYRARKAREAKISEVRESTKKFFSGLWKSRERANPVEEALLPPEDAPEEASSVCSDDDTVNCCSYVDLFYYLLWFVLWVIVYVVFIEFQFGTVFLVVSGLIFMYVNTRTGPRRSGEVSAYSVFNKNCESIDGTLKAEQFEREIRYGPAVVK